MTVTLRKVLLELSDSELEIGLGLDHPMHRKKVRLAIEERRLGFHVRYPFLSTINNTWVIKEWLVDIGLAQVSFFSSSSSESSSWSLFFYFILFFFYFLL